MGKYVNILTGEEYGQEIPEEISIEVGEIKETPDRIYHKTSVLTSKTGDPEYKGMLDSWMFRRGFFYTGD